MYLQAQNWANFLHLCLLESPQYTKSVKEGKIIGLSWMYGRDYTLAHFAAVLESRQCSDGDLEPRPLWLRVSTFGNTFRDDGGKTQTWKKTIYLHKQVLSQNYITQKSA